MTIALWDILQILGALCLFIFGIKVMSESIQKLGSGQLRHSMMAMTKNRFFGVSIGLLITALLQSSSGTTVMIISFVNAGLIGLTESVGVIMGANIGTTITGWLVSVFGFNFDIASIGLPLVAIGLPFIFMRQGKWKGWGELIIGLALLLIGLDQLKLVVANLNDYPETLQFISNYSQMGLLSGLLFVGLGILLTVLIQSSSAAITLTMVLCASGFIPLNIGAAMILGENIGTAVTAEFAALIGNVHARRSARIHTLFNVIGVAWMILVLPLVLKGIDFLLMNLLGSESAFTDSASMPIALAMFHTTFNVLNTFILIGFAPALVNLSKQIVPNKSIEEDNMYRLKYISRGILSTPDLALAEAKKETQSLGKLIEKLFSNVQFLLFENPKDRDKTIKRIRRREDITDKIEVEIAEYLTRTTEAAVSADGAQRIQTLLSIVGDMEEIGDLCYSLALTNEQIMKLGANITTNVRDRIENIFKLVDVQLKRTTKNLYKRFHEVNMEDCTTTEKEINRLQKDLQKLVFENIEQKIISPAEGIHYINIINGAEKIADHLMSINEAMVGVKYIKSDKSSIVK